MCSDEDDEEDEEHSSDEDGSDDSSSINLKYQQVTQVSYEVAEGTAISWEGGWGVEGMKKGSV